MKREYHVELPLTGKAWGTVVAESEEEAVDIFAEEYTADDIEWDFDASNAFVTEGDEVPDEDDEETP